MPAVVMRDYRASHTLILGGKTLSEGTCDIHLDDEFLMVKGTRTTRIGYDQLESFRPVGRGLEIEIHPEGKLSIAAKDGGLARPLFLHLSRLRGARWAYLLRFMDGDPLDTLECKLSLDGGAEQEALFHVYRGGVVGIPLGGDVFQLPLHELDTVSLAEYRLTCATPETSAILYGCEPRDLRRFHRSVEGARRAIEEETANLLAGTFPALQAAELAKLTDLLLRGKAAPMRALDAIAPWFWGRVEEVIASSPKASESYAYLRKRAGDHVWFGMRRLTEVEKMGQGGKDEEAPPEPAEGEEAPAEEEAEPERPFLFWIIAGLGSGEKRCLAVEVFAGTSGFATYVYRCPGDRNDARAFADTASIVSRAMVALNFYREPLYAPEKEIETGGFVEYKLAVRKLAYLRAARERFVGRAAHTTPKGWARQIEKLLA